MDPVSAPHLLGLSSFCQWPGMALGLIGAVLVAGTDRWRRQLGFGLWIISNGCWIANGAGSGTWGLVIMQSMFLGTSAVGWWNHRAQPAPAS